MCSSPPARRVCPSPGAAPARTRGAATAHRRARALRWPLLWRCQQRHDQQQQRLQQEQKKQHQHQQEQQQQHQQLHQQHQHQQYLCPPLWPPLLPECRGAPPARAAPEERFTAGSTARDLLQESTAYHTKGSCCTLLSAPFRLLSCARRSKVGEVSLRSAVGVTRGSDT